MTHPVGPLRIALAGDHAGFSLKQTVAEVLSGGGQQTVPEIRLHDCGAFDTTQSDYPDFAELVAREIVEGRADRGILVCGSGVGVSVAANKITGIRASVCHDTYTARQGVEHDDMNVLCIGGRVIGPELALEVIRAFLNAQYDPQERHARRLDKVLRLEREGLPSLKT
ncbi:ribose 5-phosphate isomerase B [Roseimaritima sediminicola]|uniref:ribose 5-phosphate isomerase B n=1 Tax=Roseimaritima sediminicola TaxID=2662066 RepID=UPI00129832F4|nr:ribose 5-phosphate isomerase B [Roseimaritima sediminicola]